MRRICSRMRYQINFSCHRRSRRNIDWTKRKECRENVRLLQKLLYRFPNSLNPSSMTFFHLLLHCIYIYIYLQDTDFRTKHLIKQALCKNQFLKNLNTNQISEIVDVMYPKDFEAGAYVIRKGDPGMDTFHMINNNTFVYNEKTSNHI